MSKTLPIVVTATVVNEVRDQLVKRGMKPTSKLAASNEAWRVVKLHAPNNTHRAVWTADVLGVLVTVSKVQGEDGWELLVQVNQNHYAKLAKQS